MATLTAQLHHLPHSPYDITHLLTGKKLDIICYETNTTLLEQVPKSMLIFFCGYQNISRLLATKYNGTNTQALCVSQRHCEYIGLKIVVAWMQRACRSSIPSSVRQLEAPKNNVLVACCIARTLRALGCRADAQRIDRDIMNTFFSEILTVPQVKDLWYSLPRGSVYVKWMLANVRTQLRNPPKGFVSEAGWKAMVMCVTGDEELHDRVDEVGEAAQQWKMGQPEQFERDNESKKIESEVGEEESWTTSEENDHLNEAESSSGVEGSFSAQSHSEVGSAVSLVEARGSYVEEEDEALDWDEQVSADIDLNEP
ncbi:hypothetical protein BDV96DRAFT_677624 [Lophiotrema nucula]|uniref:Uncharacterized protein n=1 Tax=Lophiotrema nucula TaxID=690887 RepID=A0A6A5ZI90_9PLEO|nr:hypothetical protein BDV96DRAFT_677624 [Lophiotrema nucula]